MIEKARIWLSILIVVFLVGIMGMFLSMAIASEAGGTQAVEYSKLRSFLPKAPSGWEALDEPQGDSITEDEGTWSFATAYYTLARAEDVATNVMITDYASYTTGWTDAWEYFSAYDSTEGYAKTVTVQGYPAWEEFFKDYGAYHLSVALNDRFQVSIDTNSDKDTLYKFSDAINYKGIAALGPGPAVQETAKPTPQPTTGTDGTHIENGEEESETPGLAGTDGTHTENGEEESETPGFELIVAVLSILAAVTLLVRRKG
jgi:hypothetical protein